MGAKVEAANLKLTAIHEAGHIVCGLRMGAIISGAMLTNLEGMNLEGIRAGSMLGAVEMKRYLAFRAVNPDGRFLEPDLYPYVLRDIVGLLGGYAAEHHRARLARMWLELHMEPPGHTQDGRDCHTALSWITPKDRDGIFQRSITIARGIVRRDYPVIREIAGLLLEKMALTEEDIEMMGERLPAYESVRL